MNNIYIYILEHMYHIESFFAKIYLFQYHYFFKRDMNKLIKIRHLIYRR